MSTLLTDYDTTIGSFAFKNNNLTKTKAMSVLLEDYVGLLRETGAMPGSQLADIDWDAS